eukprot:scaffold70022_cov53-Phaeocystis_antarctica.AAC.1
MQDQELHEESEVRGEVQGQMHHRWREEEAAVREDLLRLILRAPSEPVVLVRDRDIIYGDCLPKSPQPAIRAWRSPTRVRR